MARVRVPGFLPSTGGFRFDNRFPSGPVMTIDLGIVSIPIGNAAQGLCGGMVFAANDYFLAGRLPPDDPTAPVGGTPLFTYLVRRLIDSYHLPGGPATYLALMNPLLPDGDARLGPLTVHGRASRMITREWPAIRAELDAGRLCPLGLVTVKSANPGALGQNHQVLAYGYDLEGTALRLAIYDPNRAGDDTVTIALDVRYPDQPTSVTMTPDGSLPRLTCFFRVVYQSPSGPLP